MRTALALVLIVFAAPAQAGEIIPGPIEAVVVRVIDGDTVAVEARTWLDTTVETKVRLAGIDTPEKRPRAKCAGEATLADQASALTRQMLPPGAVVRLTQVEQDKYGGRVVARLASPDGRDVGKALIKARLARPYDGGTKSSWCK
jgi:endonuclease YncB( thermonuclease family)